MAARPIAAISAKPRPSRITTPGTPPSRTSRFEPTPMHGDRDIGGQAARKCGRSVAIGRTEHHLGRAADAEPGDAGERRIRASAGRAPAAGARSAARSDVGHDHRPAPAVTPGAGRSLASSPGKACAHCGDEPAPRQTTRSPGAASAIDHGGEIAPAPAAPAHGDGRGSIKPSTSASRLTPSIGASPAA